MDLLTKVLDLVEDRADLDSNGDLDCLEDDDERLNKEGNKFQNENVYNRLLPYDISAERQDHLMRIKTSLAKCIQMDQESVYNWFIDLDRFVDLYGLAFTKEEHIYFVKIQYELMTATNNLDLYHIGYVARCFSRLMRKRYLISTDELQLDWRPLYETYERLLYSETETLGLRFVPDNLEQCLSQAIRLARPHFPVEATQEMLDEWRPMLCPFSVSTQKAVTYLNLFLPTTLPVEHHDKGFKLWFDEVMQFWLGGKVNSTHDSRYTLLLSRLSSDCMGYIDWGPYIPGIFNHFKASLNLNGGVGRTCSRGRQSEQVDVGPCVQWMVYMISKDNSCLDHISKLFKAIESFYHPSNTDRRWHAKLQQFLYKLPATYVKRLYRERYKKNIWSKRIPESHKLTEEHTNRLVDSLMPVVLTSMFNQSGIGSAALAFRDLSVLRPEKVIPPLLERLYGSYETLTEPHRLLSSINCMVSVVPAMVRPCKHFLEGPSHVVPLLFNSLPGIDSNDMRKCIAVFNFIATLAAHIQMKDYSYLVDERSDLTLEQQQLCLATSQFEEFLMQFLDKCFTLIENVATASFVNLDQDAHMKNGEEGIIEASISSVMLSILAQSSPELKQATIDKLYSHVTRHMFDNKTRGRAIATLCLACAKSSPKETLAKFVPHFGRLVLTLTDNDEVFQESILDDELLFSLLFIAEIVRCNSPYLLEHKDLIISVLDRALKLTSKDGYMLGCSILRHLLRALTYVTCSDWRNIDPQELSTYQATEGHWPFNDWGHTTHINDLKLNWEVPSPESREFAQYLMDVYLRNAVADLLSWSESKRQLAREQVQRSLHIVFSSLIGASAVLPPVDLPTLNLCPYEVPFIPLCIRYAGTEPIHFKDGTNIRTFLLESMVKVLSFIRETNEDDTKSLSLICEILCTSITYFGYNKNEFRVSTQRIKTLKSRTQNKLLGKKRHLRYLLVERVAQQQRAMLLCRGQPNFTKLHLTIFNCFFDLAQSHYFEVRVLAQDSVYIMLNYFPFLEHVFVPLLVKELQSQDIEHNKLKGLLYLVLGRRSYNSIAVDSDWSFLKNLWPALVNSPNSKKLSIVRLLDRICNIVQKSFDTFELRYDFKESIKKLAAELWTSNFVDLEKYQPPDENLIEQVRSKVQSRNEKRIQDYEQLVLALVAQIEDPRLHWHRKIVAFNLFTYLMRDDHPLPLPAVKLCISSLINERIGIRLKAIPLVSAQLKLHKRKHAKRTIRFSPAPSEEVAKSKDAALSARAQSTGPIDELESKAEMISLNDESNHAIEERNKTQAKLKSNDCNTLGNSNKWMQYRLSDGDYTKEEWDKLIFIDKPHIGFYDWPKELKVYEPYEKQPQFDRSVDDMNEFELAFYEKFTDPEFIEKFVGYICLEDKGNPENQRFDNKKPSLYKGLFRNYGPCMLEPFRKYVDEYATSTCEQKQKFVIEFIAGLMRGSKHWSYGMLKDLKQYVLSIIDKMTISQENFNDWTGMANFIFRNRDAKRFEWLMKYLITKATAKSEVTSPTVTPFILSSRLTLAQYSMIQCQWRVVDHVFPIVAANLQSQDELLIYANVRICLASIFSLIYMYDDPTILSRIPGTLADGPKRVKFIESLIPKLALLEKKLSLASSVVAPTVVERKENVIAQGSSSSRYISDEIQTTEASNLTIESLAISETTDDSDMVPIISDTLMKYRSMDSESPASSASGHHHRHHDDDNVSRLPTKSIADKSTPDKTNNVGPPSPTSPNNGSFVDTLRESLPELNLPVPRGLVECDLSNESEERKDAIKLMKLTSSWIIYNVYRMKSPVPADFFKLLPIICEMNRESSDPELAADSIASVAVLGSSFLSSEAVTESLLCVRKIIAEHSWHARVAAAVFIEIMVSSNFFRLLSVAKWRSEIEDIVINHLICDERIEVRESSSLTLSGLIHCEFTKLSEELLAEFRQRASEPLIRRTQPNGTRIFDSKSMVKRHSGILCLCACVDAYPYTVPDYLPDILTLLSEHLADPQPISTTIKKTMSNFRRTHHDNWQSDKTKFTEDQLSILADLLVSPSYYA